MCLLSYFEAGVQPDTEALSNGSKANADGHGWAIVAHDRIIQGKNMKADKAIAEFASMRKRYPGQPAIFHSRFTTDGIGGKFNVHPFDVTGYTDTVMAHNGIFPQSARPRVGDIRSDTRIVAEDQIPKYQWKLETRRGRRRFGKWMGLGNKVAILTLDPRFRTNGYIINEFLGEWVDGIWYSNAGYEKPKAYTIGHSYTMGLGGYDYAYGGYREYSWADDMPMDDLERRLFPRRELPTLRPDCVHCLTPQTVNPVTMYCEFCKMCQDCDQTIVDCLCYATSFAAELKPGITIEVNSEGEIALG